MEWTAPKSTPLSPPHLLWDWGDAAAPGSSGEAAGRRGKEKRARGEGAGGGGGGAVRCQVEGCGTELGAAKEYHRKHRVCEAHTKSPRVVVAGQERRFCQQCSRWVFLDAPRLFAGVVFLHPGCPPEPCFSLTPAIALPLSLSLRKAASSTFLRLLLLYFLCVFRSWNFRKQEIQRAPLYLRTPHFLRP